MVTTTSSRCHLSPGQGKPATDSVRDRLAELARPLPHGLVAHGDAAGGQHLLHHAQAEREPKVEPDGVADDLGREAVAGVGRLGRRRHVGPVPDSQPARNLPRVNLTVPRAVRQERSRPIVDALHAWLTAQLERVSGKSGLAEAIRYALRHWTGLVLFLEDGRLELDTNTIERAIRPIALGRKNSLFAGSDGGARHWAIVASLVATAKLNGVEPLAWLTDVLERMVSGRIKAHELERLLPWTWKAERLAPAVRT
jgi:hypothetical protein